MIIGNRGFHLMLDFFHNDWVKPVANMDREIPFPEIESDGYDDHPWMNIVNPNPKQEFSYNHWTIHAPESDESENENGNFCNYDE